MSENYPRFAGYLKRALAEIDHRSATRA
jgi:hypothetical protein